MMKKLHSKKSPSGTANGSHRKKLSLWDAPLFSDGFPLVHAVHPEGCDIN